jgi:hypothetical protein
MENAGDIFAESDILACGSMARDTKMAREVEARAIFVLRLG